jgi:PadR family transcriptional regulator PadR
MLSYRWVESSGGPPRKYFSLTEKGEAFYKDLETTWKDLVEGVNKVTNN